MASRFFFNSERTLNVNLVSLAIRMESGTVPHPCLWIQDALEPGNRPSGEIRAASTKSQPHPSTFVIGRRDFCCCRESNLYPVCSCKQKIIHNIRSRNVKYQRNQFHRESPAGSNS